MLLIGPEDGLSVRLEDESKTLQSSIFMRPDVGPLLPPWADNVYCRPCIWVVTAGVHCWSASVQR